MASTMASNDRTSWQYTDDQANVWAISAKSVYVTGVDAAKYGGQAATNDDKPIPGNFKPRRAQFVDATGNVKWVVCYTTAAAAWATPATTLTLNLRGVDTTFTKGRRTRGESVNHQAVLPGN